MALSGNREGGSPRARLTLHLTSTDRGPLFDGAGEFTEGHNHTWREGSASTSVDAGHSHRVVLGRVHRVPNERVPVILRAEGWQTGGSRESMNGRVSRLIHRYASTYVTAGQGAGRQMERIVKRQWNEATAAERKAIKHAIEIRLRRAGGR